MGPTLDWTCSHCGNRETWKLVKADDAADREAPRHPADRATLDFTCSRCGTTETWTLVRAGVRAAPGATSR